MDIVYVFYMLYITIHTNTCKNRCRKNLGFLLKATHKNQI